jgi:hypothetical protein
VNTVRLRHPATGHEFDAPERAVDQYARAGWVPTDQPPEQADDVPADVPAFDQGGTLPSGVTTEATSVAEPVLAPAAEQPEAGENDKPKPTRGRRSSKGDE